MKYCFWIILLLLATSPLSAKDDKLLGYVMDAGAFRRIQTYCIDTRYLPPWEERIVKQFVARQSHPKGVLARLPWRRVTSCEGGAADARVRLEFPRDHFMAQAIRNDVNGMLFVFKPGSPSPIYETREVVLQGDENALDAISAVLFREQGAVDYAVRALVHDWLKFTTPVATSAEVQLR